MELKHLAIALLCFCGAFLLVVLLAELTALLKKIPKFWTRFPKLKLWLEISKSTTRYYSSKTTQSKQNTLPYYELLTQSDLLHENDPVQPLSIQQKSDRPKSKREKLSDFSKTRKRNSLGQFIKG